jgi:hypothetical protein
MEYILLDTNVWRSTALLRGILGRVLISHLQLSGKRLLLPETVEKEVIETVTGHLTSLCDEIDARSNELDEYNTDVFDNEFYLPNASEIRQAVKKRLRELSPLMVKRPLTLRQTRGALDMVVRHEPPNIGKREEFRDSLIWQAALDSDARDTVHFVSSDKAFFENQDPKQPLVSSLRKMAKARAVKVLMYPALENYLTSTLRSAVALREEEYTRQLREWLDPHAEKVLQEIVAGTSAFVGAEYVPVPSLKAKTITVQFNLSYKSREVPARTRDQGIVGGGIVLKGAACFRKTDGKLRRAELTEGDRHKVDSMGNAVDLPSIWYILKNRANKASEATSEPAPSAASSAPQG